MAMDMRSMVGALAQLPPDQRKTMMRARLEQFAAMNDLERAAAMRQMMEAVGGLSRDDAKKLLAARTEILFELPESSRMTLMKTHMGLLTSMPTERVKMEMELVGEIAPQLSPAAQRGVQEMMKMMPMPAMGGPASMPAMGGPASMSAVRAAPRSSAPRFAGWANALLWLSVVAGAWLVIAPFVLGYTGAAQINDIVIGVAVIVLTGIVALWRPVEV